MLQESLVQHYLSQTQPCLALTLVYCLVTPLSPSPVAIYHIPLLYLSVCILKQCLISAGTVFRYLSGKQEHSSGYKTLFYAKKDNVRDVLHSWSAHNNSLAGFGLGDCDTLLLPSPSTQLSATLKTRQSVSA